ncbi:non-ribosomal peptide synthetase [Pedobacter roseus]|uniref:Amino acid adenylation domain-containing protein n=1 Tax=Pedobacter roseus TaxID=336820 RepID=A0A7G9QKQ5_9SPHI|nr:non-ribosomal peptide synthetase [Pedobacter roseus]QNN43930.1 amino acid adenylation domain-containing protein [Pedobacter roseus]
MSPLEIVNKLRENKVIAKIDGENIRLIGEIENISDDLMQLIKSTKKELLELLRQSVGKPKESVIKKVLKKQSYPLSNAQKRIWILSQFEGGEAVYNIVSALHLNGIVEEKALSDSFQMVINRHESLRTIFKDVDGTVDQVILQDLHFYMESDDYSKVKDIPSSLLVEIEKANYYVFDLENGPLIKVKLIKIDINKYSLILCLHHIISDGWSIGVLMKEVMYLYECIVQKKSTKLPPLRINYKDYVSWKIQGSNTENDQLSSIFWKNVLNDTTPPLNLPIDYLRPPVRSFNGMYNRFHIEASLFKEVSQFCSENNCTLFNFFHTCLAILLNKLTDQKEIVVGTVVSGRSQLELENQIGLYVNTLPLKAKIDYGKSFIHLLIELRNDVFKMFEYQNYPFDKIVDDLDSIRNPSRNPLFDVMIVFQNTAIADGSIDLKNQYGFELSTLDNYLLDKPTTKYIKRPSKFDLTFHFELDPDGDFILEIEFSTDIFMPESIKRFYRYFRNIFRQVLDFPDIAIGSIGLLSSVDRHVILEEFNRPICDSGGRGLSDLLSSSFSGRLDRKAVIYGNSCWSYKELRVNSSAISSNLSRLGTASGSFVGLLMGRSPWTIACILGVLNIGKGYVPIDINYPSSRIDYIINDAAFDLLIVDGAGSAVVPSSYKGRVLHLDDLDLSEIPDSWDSWLPEGTGTDDSAYLIYTSGTTGSPKGVDVSRGNLAAFLEWSAKEFSDTPFEVMYATTSYSFDLSVFEFLFPLVEGKSIRLLDSALYISDFLGIDQKIMINTVPSVVKTLLEEGIEWNNVVALNMAGEQISKKLISEIDTSEIEVRNLYGPSEDTVYSTMYRFHKRDLDTVPIGKAIDNTHIYILDSCHNLLPVGVEGEIYLSGHCITKGYHGRADLTEKYFFENPFVPGLRMYKTGDRGRWLEDGNVEFLGRNDDQVKIRGYRIELSEIQYGVESFPGVKRAVAVVQDVKEDREIVVYWVGGDEVQKTDLIGYLSSILPSYMMPAHWVKLDEIPYNSNGKIDKKRLPDITEVFDELLEHNYTDLESSLIQLWSDILHTNKINSESNFFELGGQSLKVLRLRTLISERFHRTVSLNELFQFCILKEQAKIIESKKKAQLGKITPAPFAERYPLSFSQERLWVLSKFEDASSAYNIPICLSIDGKLEKIILEAAFVELIRDNEILRTVFIESSDGPAQVIIESKEVNFSVTETDCSDYVAFERFLKLASKITFNLEKAPLFSCSLITFNLKSFLFLNIHHIISDRASINILIEELQNYYRLISKGKTININDSKKLHFKDFALWQKNNIDQYNSEESVSFWQKYLGGQNIPLDFPTSFQRPPVKTYCGEVTAMNFSDEIFTKLKGFAIESNSTLFMSILSAINILLYKYSNQNDIVIGTPISGRNNAQLEKQMGFFVDLLPIRTVLNDTDSFRALVAKQKQDFIEILEHQSTPFGVLLDLIDSKRDITRAPLFDILLVLDDVEDLNLNESSDDIAFQIVKNHGATAKYDLTFMFVMDGGLSLELEYNTDLFKEFFVSDILQKLNNIFRQVLDFPDIAIGSIGLLSSVDRHVILEEFNRPICDSGGRGLSDLLSSSFSGRLDRKAVIYGNSCWSYKELRVNSSAISSNLSRLGTASGSFVGLLMGRSPWTIACILGVLNIGKGYVPIDINYPSSRIDYIINDAAFDLLIVDGAGSAVVPSSYKGRVLHLDDLDLSEIPDSWDSWLPEGTGTDDSAYLIYTSGTTGSPKGVDVSRGNLAAFLEWSAKEFSDTPFEVMYATTSYSFDLSVFEFLFPLVEGKSIRLLDSALYISDFLGIDQKIMINTVPSVVKTLLEEGIEWNNVVALNMAGEQISKKLISEIDTSEIEVRNLYGPSEDTVYSTMYRFHKRDLDTVPIGKAIDNTHIYILDSCHNLLPVGVEGEIYLSGHCITKGYHGRADLTEKYFFENPFVPGLRMYKTGDRGRWLEDGNVEFLGRNDDQVKIRGYRIELSEIQYGVESFPGVKRAVAVVQDVKEDREIVVYWVGGDEVQKTDLIGYLSSILPSYMMPAHWVKLDEIPYNSNGKIDKKRLPDVDRQNVSINDYVATRNLIDEKLVLIWQEVLNIKNFGITDNFFDIGGHSLKAIRVISRIQNDFNVKIDLKSLFQSPTIENLSDYIEIMQWMNTNENIGNAENEIIF